MNVVKGKMHGSFKWMWWKEKWFIYNILWYDMIWWYEDMIWWCVELIECVIFLEWDYLINYFEGERVWGFQMHEVLTNFYRGFKCMRFKKKSSFISMYDSCRSICLRFMKWCIHFEQLRNLLTNVSVNVLLSYTYSLF